MSIDKLPDVFDVLEQLRKSMVSIGCERAIHGWDPCEPGKPNCDVCKAIATLPTGMLKAIREVVEVVQVDLNDGRFMTSVMKKKLTTLSDLLKEQRP